MITDQYKYKSVEVARYIIAYANDKRFGINMTKLQKLLYITYGVYLAVKGSRLTDEHPQAWPYEPVFPTARSRLLKTDFSEISINADEFRRIMSDSEMSSLISLVFISYGGWNAGELTSWSHAEGTPWERTVNTIGFKWGDQIPDEYISEYFNSIIIRKNGR